MSIIWTRRVIIKASLLFNFCALTYVALHASNTSISVSDSELKSSEPVCPSGYIETLTSNGKTCTIPERNTDAVSEAEVDTDPNTTYQDVVSADPLVTEKPPTPLFTCEGKSSEFRYGQRGSQYILYNYIRAKRQFKCDESITLTTHGDTSFLDNLVVLSQRWQGPISVSVYVPSSDYDDAIKIISYLRQCTVPEIEEFVTFHFVFDNRHMPKSILKLHTTQQGLPYFESQTKVRTSDGKTIVKVTYHGDKNGKTELPTANCSLPAPWGSPPKQTYRNQKKLLYPVNVLRNVARESATTYYVFASDSELYPSPNIIPQFFDMLRRNESYLNLGKHRLFALPIFEVYSNQTVPDSKQELVKMLESGMAIPFHKKICASCHSIPRQKEWLKAPVKEGLSVFHVGKRHKPHHNWEPIFIGTQDDPLYDERLSWEGRRDKMTQGYALCILDYDFMILDNAFLVHRPGVKVNKKDPVIGLISQKQNAYIKSTIVPELKVLYGSRPECWL
ncbi:beta-1,4-glucuronyltransferase 1-like [Artemia franciscana]|uniref:N-acetyllactosaminide beta-1,3-N-acetylglucosaminyltransferase n=1 Tax=Artemia franciscana TaxID=6661 RepID=A0AA88I0Z8_ARTSF|nr:hypothetical protein QYM36_004969 [Artemia franciscana]